MGTGRGQIYEVQVTAVNANHAHFITICAIEKYGQQNLLMDNHHSGELWGLATAPAGDYFVTAGDDKTLRVWDIVQRKLLVKARMKGLMRAAAYSPDGRMLAVGFGAESKGATPDEMSGGFCVVDASTLEVIFEGQDSKEWIQDIKFSPDGTTLAVCSHDCKIYLYDVKSDFAKKAVCKGHNRFVTHVDFTADGRNWKAVEC